MESDILTEILRKLNARLRREKRTIVLLMDNAPCHPEDLNDKFSQIKIVFLPKNTTSRLQPLDLGIIQTFKLKYYKRILTHVVNKVDDCSTASEVCKSVDILQAIRWTAMAWNDVPKSTVVKCFIKAGVLNCEGETNTAEAGDSDFNPFAELDSDINIVKDLAKETRRTNVVSIKETVNGCFDPPICQELPDNWEDSFFDNYARVTWMSQTTTTMMEILMMRFRNFLRSRSWLPIERQYLALKMSCIFLNPRGMLTRQILCLK